MAKVLVTRAMPEAEDTARDLVALGHIPILAPLRHAEAVMTPLPSQIPDGLIATSRNAFQHGPSLPPEWASVPVWCVGEKTADAARMAGFSVIFVADGDAIALARQVLAARPMPRRMLYLAGELRGDALETSLRAEGVDLDVVLRYRMKRRPALPKAARAALADSDIDAILHFSAESARAFFALAGAAGLVEAASRPWHCCLSSAVAEAVIEAAGRQLKTIIASKPTGFSLVEAITTHCGGSALCKRV